MNAFHLGILADLAHLRLGVNEVHSDRNTCSTLPHGGESLPMSLYCSFPDLILVSVHHFPSTVVGNDIQGSIIVLLGGGGVVV